MNRILIQTSNYLNKTETGTLIWRPGQLNIHKASSLLFVCQTGFGHSLHGKIRAKNEFDVSLLKKGKSQT